MHEFIAMLAHELRNPLAPIRNAVALMGRKGLQDPTLESMRTDHRSTEHPADSIARRIAGCEPHCAWAVLHRARTGRRARGADPRDRNEPSAHRLAQATRCEVTVADQPMPVLAMRFG